MAEPWTSSLLFVTLNIMELRSYYTHWKSIVVWHLRIWKNTLHTQSTNVNHLQCHIMVPPSFNQWDKIGTLQHFFLTISRNSSSTLLFLRNIWCEVMSLWATGLSTHLKLLYLKPHYQLQLIELLNWTSIMLKFNMNVFMQCLWIYLFEWSLVYSNVKFCTIFINLTIIECLLLYLKIVQYLDQ